MSEYKQIFRSTSLIGSVQVMNIAIGILRNKVAAVFLGAEGVGLMGMLNQLIDLIRNFSLLGLNISAVVPIAEAKTRDDRKEIISTMRFWFLLLGSIGSLVLFLFAPYFSQLFFRSDAYTGSVRIVAPAVLFLILQTGILSLFQGVRQIKKMAICNALAALVSLLLALPLFTLWGIESIFVYQVLFSFSLFIIAFILSRPLLRDLPQEPLQEVIRRGRSMIRLGVFITVNVVIGSVIASLIRLFIQQQSGLAAVGIFSVGTTFLDSYFGILFSAMATDYFPRLVAVKDSHEKTTQTISQQIHVGVNLIAPLASLLILLAPWIIPLLNSSEFLDAAPILLYGSFSLLLKAIYIPMDYLLYSREDKRGLLLIETLSGIYVLIGVCGGFYLDGWRGIGLGYSLAALLNTLQIGYYIRRFYQTNPLRVIWKSLAKHLPFPIILLLLLQLSSPIAIYSTASIAVLIQLAISFFAIRKEWKR